MLISDEMSCCSPYKVKVLFLLLAQLLGTWTLLYSTTLPLFHQHQMEDTQGKHAV